MTTPEKICLVLFILMVILLGAIVYQLASAEDVVVEGEVPPPVAVGVQRGDTLWGIAKEFYPNKHTGMVVEAIRKLNPGVDPGKLQVGQMILLPQEV